MKKMEIDIDALLNQGDYSFVADGREYNIRLVSTKELDRDKIAKDKKALVEERKKALEEIRKKLGAPFIGENFKPLTREEIYERG